MTLTPVQFVGAGPGDPDLLTLQAARALAQAEVVLYDRLVSAEVLALCNPAAQMVSVGKHGFGPSTPQPTINALLVAQAQSGARVVRLKAGDPMVFGRLDEELTALEAAGLKATILPGITSAAAASAALGQSLTQRGRNTQLRFVTAHDTKGFNEADWRGLAQPGSVAAIYMGKRAARFLQGRLLMHGAAPDTPITAVFNASRPDMRVLPMTLASLATDLAQDNSSDPAILMLGLAPRGVPAVLPHLHPQQEAL